LDYWKARYGFEPSPSWLQHVRLASLRFGQICSASFVSPDGLVMTNHHCSRDCVSAVSPTDSDYVANGFYAPTRADEKLCPDLYLDQLVAITNVTDSVRGVTPAGAGDEAVAEARDSAEARLERRCEDGPQVHCQVVNLYHGGQFQLYRYHRYAPVKLVFAPELQAGYFGGDDDNFTYPRFALDVAFFRAYAPDSTEPIHPENYFRWDSSGPDEGEAVFLTGNPGSTDRLATVSELLYEGRYQHPFRLQYFHEIADFYREIEQRNPAAARQIRERLFEIENTIKSYTGELKGLRDADLMGEKLAWERAFRDSVASNPALKRKYGDVWDRVARIAREKLDIAAARTLDDPGFLGSPYVSLAGELVDYVRYHGQPADSLPEGLTSERIQQMGQHLRSGVSPDPGTSARILRIRLDLVRDWLPTDDTLRRLVFRPGESPTDAARRLVESSRLGDPTFREALMNGGRTAIDTTSDPMIALVRMMDARYRRLDPRWKQLGAAETVQEGRLAEALFAVFGTNVPPDATFTLRISDGVVKRYPYNGTVAPAFTNFYGLYARAAAFGDTFPFELARHLETARDSLDLKTRFDFVSTNDIAGGNSGSPVVDRQGRAVGVAFDGNIEQLPNNYLFRDERGRTVAVDAAGITEALEHAYHARALVDELLGRSGTSRGNGGD
ncbi:MAG: S46 family peptidase, partial [Candidatus Palauibacterales bacterium]|nr:S46 family peptidase [Candidatus Palauibacterales bacterium]